MSEKKYVFDSNADRTGLWELSILACHVHPSVATMARTLLSGANIVYNGDPLSDLSLGAFLDKFMEKKPKPNKKAEGNWHGGSQIAPAKKLNMSHHLIGDEILQLAEEDVPPEDVIFHRFYMNRTTASKKPKKAKKASADDGDADLLFDENGREEEEADVGEEDEEEIDNFLSAEPLPFEEEEGEFDYDDLDRAIEGDDEELLGNGSDDAEAEPASDLFAMIDDDDGDGDNDRDIEIWGTDTDEEDGNRGDGNSNHSLKKKKKKIMKAEKKSRPSPFANVEDFEHLMAEDRDRKTAGDGNKRHKSKSEKRKRKN